MRMCLRMYELVYSKEARDQIAKFSLKIKRQLKKSIERLAHNPKLGKRLSQELTPYQSYRSGDYRIIYQVLHKQLQILIFTIGNRKAVYKSLKRKRP